MQHIDPLIVLMKRLHKELPLTWQPMAETMTSCFLLYTSSNAHHPADVQGPTGAVQFQYVE